MTSKQTLRQHYKAQRAALSAQEHDTLSTAITDRFFEILPEISVSCVHIFLPIARQNEIDTWKIIKRLWTENPAIKTVVPVMTGDGRSMVSCLVDSQTHFETDEYGIPTPTTIIPVADSDIDLVLTPLLCINPEGHRIGYGKGFYDRFFASCPPHTLKIGLSLFQPTEEPFEIDKFDVALDGWITPSSKKLL